VGFVESLRIALRTLGANRVRSALTMLGVIVGVAAVILLVSIGTGVKTVVTGQLEGLGSNLIFVIPQNVQQLRGGTGGSSPFAVRKPLTNEDAELLANRLGSSAIVVPVLTANVSMKAGNNSTRASMAAGNALGTAVFNATLQSGRHYTHTEWVNGSRVVALGSDVRDTLFPGQDPVGRQVDIEGQRFRVVGHYQPKGGSFAGTEDNQIYIPSTTAQRLLGTKKITQIVIKSVDPTQVELVKARAEQALRPRFGDDFTVLTQQQTLGILSTLLGTLTAMLAGIAAISLLVGGVGIMNIMLVSVSERTREIGIRKAVGARTYDILTQFVIEAMVLSALGGVAGIVIGAVGAWALRPWVPAEMTAGTLAIAFSFSAAIGMFFGVYPASKASRLDPIEALRYE
jgi:putative ABC transport system permease protein